VALWQVVVWSGWRESYVLPGPAAVFGELADRVRTSSYWEAIGVTMTRGVIGFAVATVIGLVLGIAVARIRPLRTAVGSMITGLQTMPSIAWFPLAILLFQLSEKAILFVIVLGAAPSVANGVISGVDYVPPLLLRAGRNMGATGLSLYRYVVLPAALPSLVSGLKQGWAFAWRSLMAGELLVVIAERPSLGVHLQLSREFGETAYMIGLMITILLIGIVVDLVLRRGRPGDPAPVGSPRPGPLISTAPVADDHGTKVSAGLARRACLERPALASRGVGVGADSREGRYGPPPGRGPTMRGVDISAKSDYAVRALLALAAAEPSVVKIETLATAQQLPRKFLEAILGDVRRAGIVRSQRGADGGYALARPASQIALADVIRAVDGPLAEVRGLRPENTAYTGAAEHLQTVWVAVRASLRVVLEQVSLADVVSGQLPDHVRKLAAPPEAWAPPRR
jgi:NitT/TauT family transport system permease protein